MIKNIVNNKYTKVGTGVIILVLILAFIWSRPSTKEWLKNFKETMAHNEQTIVQGLEEEKKAANKRIELLQKENDQLEKEKNKLILERQNAYNKQKNLEKEIADIKDRKIQALPKDKDETVKAFNALGFTVIYRDCQ